MDEYLQAFILGNGAILGNVCVLPLYPGLIAFLGGMAGDGRSQRSRPFLGFIVFAGVVTIMVGLGALLFQLNRSFSSIFDWLLPVIFGVVVLLGLLMIAGKNPFARMTTAQVPMLRNPVVTAFLYGMLLGPMTLPCTGPVVISAFVLGVGDVGSLVDGLLYFIAFGFGFGWPLVLLPFVAAPAQRQITGFLTRHHTGVERWSGALLIAVAIYGFSIDVLPNIS